MKIKVIGILGVVVAAIARRMRTTAAGCLQHYHLIMFRSASG